MVKSPLQLVKEKYGSKEKLVEAAASVLAPLSGEPAEAFAKRLTHVANAKLLHLVQVADKVKALGGKDSLVAKVAELRGQAKDKDFLAKLGASSVSALLDVYTVLTKKARATAKSAPVKAAESKSAPAKAKAAPAKAAPAKAKAAAAKKK